jgi:ribonucleoside-diphosphate reductase alpha chain
LDGAQLAELNPQFEKVARSKGFYSKELMKQVTNGQKLEEINNVPQDIKKVFVTSHGISPEWHIKMQAAFQRSTNNAVSKTINFPNHATREDITKSYIMAYEECLKGITIYRDRSRDAQVLVTDNKQGDDQNDIETGVTRTPRKRTKITKGATEKVTTGCGNMYVTVNLDDQGICEVFSTLGKAGGCASAQLEATCRLISLALRTGVEVTSISRQLRGIRCPSIAWEDGKSVLSCADAIASVLEKHINGDDEGSQSRDFGITKNLAGQCPECGNLLVFQEGCFICPSCGYTKC